MALAQIRKLHQVWQVKYEYTDYELHNVVQLDNYFETLEDVSNYIKQCYEDCLIVEHEIYQCRVNQKIKIQQVSLPDRKYVQLFKKV